MKIKSLILAFPVLCLACNNPGTYQDPASQMDASPLVAKKVVGVSTLVTDFNYDDPCTIVGEEFVRSAFKLEETTKVEEANGHEGCEFVWEGNKVIISFVGKKPFASVFTAQYMFDKMFGSKEPVAVAKPEADSSKVETTSSSEGTNPNAIVTNAIASTGDKHTEAMAAEHMTAPSVGMASGKAVQNLGDKAVWDEAKGAMHVLYNNNIINVMVSTKGKAEMREEQAKSIAEVLIEKIAENEYTRRM